MNAKLGMLDAILDKSKGFHIFNGDSSDAMVIMTTFLLMLGRLDGMKNAGSEGAQDRREGAGGKGKKRTRRRRSRDGAGGLGTHWIRG